MLFLSETFVVRAILLLADRSFFDSPGLGEAIAEETVTVKIMMRVLMIVFMTVCFCITYKANTVPSIKTSKFNDLGWFP